MSKFLKLPDNLKFWKINTLVSNESGNELYKISKKDFDGTIINAYLRHISAYGDAYTEENVAFLEDEAKFLSSIAGLGSLFNYIDISSNNNESKKKYDLYIITEDLPKLSDDIKNSEYSDVDTVDFGVQMTTILELLESKNIFHGNINPDNIYVTSDKKYKLGGFSDFESKISDMSFIAPEVFRKEPADFTTDIYSLGVIMYYLCNNKKIPFEDDSNDKKSAIDMRFNSKNITAPVNGNEKLKSVIVIACQPENGNRWKNASNIKNALLSIQGELPKKEKIEHSPDVIPTEPTEFEENVFEEYDYEEFKDDDNSDESKPNLVADAAVVGAAIGAGAIAKQAIENAATPETVETTETPKAQQIADDNDESGFEIAEVTETNPQNNDTDFEEAEKEEEFLPENEVLESSTDNTADEIKSTEKAELTEDNTNNFEEDVVATEVEEPIATDVFDDYEVTGKKPIIDKTESKDYGDFFDDEKDLDIKSTTDTKDVDIFSESDNVDIQQNDDFDNAYDGTSNKSNKKRNGVIIAVCVVVMLAAIGFIAFCIISGINNNSQKDSTTAPSTDVASTTQVATTVQPTTVAPTTQPTTVAQSDANVIPVVGYGYSYAKKLLEAEGFVVEIGEYRYSTIYDEGYVIAQTPEGDINAEYGSTVTLDISLGIEQTEPETTQEPTQPQTRAVSSSNNSATNNSYLFANSNSAYLSKSDVSSLSQQNLNIALNEIYARHGRIFKDSTLSTYFNSQKWYTPLYTSEEFSQNVTFNKYEQANLQLMVNEQKEKGYR